MSDPHTPNSDPDSTAKLEVEAERLADAARDRAQSAFEELKVTSNQVVDKVREFIEEGNVRRISIKRGDRTLLEVPLTVGVGAGAGAVLINAPLAAVGALAALVADVTLVVERDPDAVAASDAVANVNAPSASGEAGDSDKTVGKPSA